MYYALPMMTGPMQAALLFEAMVLLEFDHMCIPCTPRRRDSFSIQSSLGDSSEQRFNNSTRGCLATGYHRDSLTGLPRLLLTCLLKMMMSGVPGPLLPSVVLLLLFACFSFPRSFWNVNSKTVWAPWWCTLDSALSKVNFGSLDWDKNPESLQD